MTEKQFAELRRAMAALMRKESRAHTLSPTALVNEVWLRLRRQRQVDWGNSELLLTAARVAAKRILVDHARGSEAKRRGQRISIDSGLGPSTTLPGDVPGLEHAEIRFALAKLASADPALHQVIFRHYAEGQTVAEIALATHQSASTVKRQLRAGLELLRQYAQK